MTKREKQTDFFRMVALLIVRSHELSTPLCPLEWMRSESKQALLVARGASKTMDSKHLQGLAMDFCFIADLKDDGKLNYSPEKYRALGEYWESLGGRWGGRFGQPDKKRDAPLGWDSGHFEYKD